MVKVLQNSIIRMIYHIIYIIFFPIYNIPD